MSSSDVFAVLNLLCHDLAVDPDLASALITVEDASVDPYVTRYEKGWAYFVDPERFALLKGITVETEKIHQATSWSPMQVMGAVARELGFMGHLTQLTSLSVGLKYGLLKLKSLVEKYKDLDDAISTYNQGNPRKNLDGTYINQIYVDKVNARLRVLRAI